MKKIVLITGIRPNIVKAFSLYRALLEEKNFQPIFIHTNQHNEKEMFRILWNEFKLPKPILLQYKAKDEAERLGKIIIELNKKLRKIKPFLVVVFGDGDSTLAGALTASKLKLTLVHVEAGLRSFDEEMSEEKNRVLVDHLSNLLFTTESSAYTNLCSEEIDKEKIHFVGNTMIDTLKILLDKTKDITDYGFKSGSYLLLTLHRPSNVDNKEQLIKIFNFLSNLKEYPVIFPIHPRTKKRLEIFALKLPSNVFIMRPLSYLEFLCFEKDAFAVLTDSGGVQEETTYLKIPCLTLRSNTERPITLEIGSNALILDELNDLEDEQDFKFLFERSLKRISLIPELWDGKASKRIVDILKKRK